MPAPDVLQPTTWVAPLGEADDLSALLDDGLIAGSPANEED